MSMTKHLMGEEQRERMPPTLSTDPIPVQPQREQETNVKAERAI